jgi:hypothetical protein
MAWILTLTKAEGYEEDDGEIDTLTPRVPVPRQKHMRIVLPLLQRLKWLLVAMKTPKRTADQDFGLMMPAQRRAVAPSQTDHVDSSMPGGGVMHAPEDTDSAP